jgi:hypothetical protein
MKIKEVTKTSSKLKKFEQKEWEIADTEHYGKPRNFEVL